MNQGWAHRTPKKTAAAAKKRRSELDKLLEAGSSSFHFETARQTANRLGQELGPIHVDTRMETDTSEDDESAEEEPLEVAAECP